ncbi:PREDICTED: sideroflexin-4 [Elephantulus edwardii]|uniref:sideroflexin-4 n=1 Tax=Elephantulus edwardii TaxID=28737 RepID=UPI0003F064B1|nr:PREDICTED: sideroflexin-4 [Elephantulus edwardii]
MEPNLLFWITERPSFMQRFLLWTELLDPTNVVISSMQEAWKRSLGTVHPDSSKLIPAPFRPAAFLPLTAPMVFFSMMPSKGIKSMILPQLSLCSYTTAFNIINGNPSSIIPQLVQMRYSHVNGLAQFFVRRAFPVVFLAQASALNVFLSRVLEPARGIKVMDKKGRVIGHSRRAGDKAVRDTALSRTVLFGASACVSEILTSFFKRTQLFLQRPSSLWAMKLSCSILGMALMVPVSFSMFPQVGQMQSSQLENEIRSSTEETELFYNRGL